MTETQRNIKRYRASLPGLRERITATAMLLVISLSMVVSTTFAWYTISSAPEVSAINTTIAANGNLEIALAQGSVLDNEKKPPEASKVGDSAAAENNSLVAANVTWGNLVNLSDHIYGLSEISLRPAQLSGYNLTTAPLYGAVYSADGRIVNVSETYEYATYTNFGQDEFGKDQYAFAAGSDKVKHGVRAITSVKYEFLSPDPVPTEMWAQINSSYSTAKETYENIILGKTYVAEGVSCMDALSTLVELYVQDKANTVLGEGNPADYSGVVTYTYRLLEKYWAVLEAEGNGLLYLANLQAYLNNPNADRTSETFETIEDLLSHSDSDLEATYGVTLKSLVTYRTNRTQLWNAIKPGSTLEQLAKDCDPDSVTDPNPVAWSQISGSVQCLVNISTATINDMVIGTLSKSDLTGLASILMFNSKNNKAKVVVKEGALKDTEQRLGSYLKEKEIWMSVYLNVESLGVNKNVYATIETDATDKSNNTDPPNAFVGKYDQGVTAAMKSTGAGGDAVAKETYGMAVDLWLRTNMSGVNLILEGNADTEEVDKICLDQDGVERVMYAAALGESSVDLYQIDGVWYNAVTHAEIGSTQDLKDAGYDDPVIQKKLVVKGYSGVNRVWPNTGETTEDGGQEDMDELINAGLLNVNSTTQGAGSCYVFYADPSEQGRILEMLKAFTITFLGVNGNNLATAKLDIDLAYAINGKVTVPLKLTNGMEFEDKEGKKQYSILQMEQNQETWITAIVYLDGSQISNDHVLSASNIDGRLNLQFGSSISLNSGENLELKKQYRTLSAKINYGGKDYTNPDDPVKFDYDGNGKEVTVTVMVDGEHPSTMNGFFVRMIGAAQGSRLESVPFERQGDVWIAKFELTKPGFYVINSVIADGVEYLLETTIKDGGEETVIKNYPAVEISGMNIGAVTCEYWTTGSGTARILTAEESISVGVTAEIQIAEKLQPKKVRAEFHNPDDPKDIVTAVMTYNSSFKRWEGDARFNKSGNYVLTYLYIDGYPTELDAEQQARLSITLGLRARVWSSTVLPDEFEGPVDLSVQVRIVDSIGNEQRDLNNVSLFYHSTGSSLDQNGMSTELTWNPTTKYYEGTMRLSAAGSYVFNRVTVKMTDDPTEEPSRIEKYINAPTFTIRAAEPPVFDGHDTVAYQLVPDGGAKMAVKMKYAAGINNMWAVVRNVNNGTNGALYLMPLASTETLGSASDNYAKYYFNVPEVNDKQDGEWRLEAICMQGVYIKDAGENGEGLMYGITETPPDEINYMDTCYVIDVYDEEKAAGDPSYKGNYTYVVETINVSVARNNTAVNSGVVFGKSGNDITGTFMQSYDETGVTVTITDWNSNAVKGISDGISNVQMIIDYDGSAMSHGGYYQGTNANGLTPTTTQWAVSSEGKVYTAAKQTFQKAGYYEVDLKYTVAGKTYTREKVLSYSVWSKTPTVGVDSVSPSGSINVDNANGTHTTATNQKVSATEAKVYIKCTKETKNYIVTTKTYHKYTASAVTMKLENSGMAVEATLSFRDSSQNLTTHLYGSISNPLGEANTTENSTSAYKWGGSNTTKNGCDGTKMLYVGYSQYSNFGGTSNGSKTAAGTIQAKELVLRYDLDGDGTAEEYIVPISTITIQNPY